MFFLCLSITKRHTTSRSWTEAFALLRCRGREGNVLRASLKLPVSQPASGANEAFGVLVRFFASSFTGYYKAVCIDLSSARQASANDLSGSALAPSRIKARSFRA